MNGREPPESCLRPKASVAPEARFERWFSGCGEFVAFPANTTTSPPPHIELETPFMPLFSVSLLLMQTAITTLVTPGGDDV
jgi:hypothetical protein